MEKKNLNVLITGASTGIGAATAKLLAPGNSIHIHYNRSEKEAQECAREVEAAGGKAFLHQADLSGREGCEKLAGEMSAHSNTLDVLVNNAGGMLCRHAHDETTWDILQQTFSLNTFSAMYLTALVIPLMKNAPTANIINITSIAARNGAATSSAYAAAKGAMDTWTRGLAAGLAPAIRANSIAPGVIITPFHDKSTPPELLEKFMSVTPLGKPGYPEEIAEAVRFIINSPFLTGESIDINGGMYMR